MKQNTIIEWKPVKGYEGLYEVSENGDVMNLKTQRLLKPCVGNLRGFVLVALSNKGKTKSQYVHKLVADAFIKPEKNKFQVLHIDCNKQNNHYSNLKWVTISERMEYNTKNETYPTGMAWINVYSKKGKITVSRLFNSETEAIKNKNIGYIKTIEITNKL